MLNDDLTDKSKSWVPFLVLFVLWFLLVLPAAALNTWVTLDLGSMMLGGKSFPGNILSILSPYNGSDRYFPLYNIYHFTLARLFGTYLPGYFLVLASLFLISTYWLCSLCFRFSKNIFYTSLLAVLLIFSTPNAENLYSIGKSEPLSCFFLVSVIYVFYRTRFLKGLASIVSYCVIALLFACAIFCKETSSLLIGMAPVALVLYGFLGWIGIRNKETPYLQFVKLFGAMVVGFGISRLPYLLFKNTISTLSISAHSYVDYKISLGLIEKNCFFYLSQQPDIIFFGLLAVLFLLGTVVTHYKRGAKFDPKTEFDFVLVSGITATSCAYILGLIVWRWPMAYYLFMPSLLLRLAAVYGLYSTVRDRSVSPGVLRLCYGLIGIFVLYAAAALWYVGASQTEHSMAYTDAINTYLKIAKPDDKLIIESFPSYSQQSIETRFIFQILTGKLYNAQGINDNVDPAANSAEMMSLMQVTQKDIDNNEVNLPKKGDYLLVMTGNKLATWFIRGVSPYYTDDSILKKEGAYDMELISEKKFHNAGPFFNIWTNHISNKKTYLGYKLYKVTSDPRFMWRDRYTDHWMGKSAVLKLYPSFGPKASFTVSTPDFNSPNTLRVYQNDILIKTIPMIQGQLYHFDVSNMSSPNEIRFVVENIVKAPHHGFNYSPDSRDLGILIELDQPQK